MKEFNLWLKETGVSEVTGWRWEKAGTVKVTRIGRKKFISNDEIARLNQRTESPSPIARAFEPLAPWLRSVRVSQRTGLRWEKAGVITVIRIRGRKYITRDSAERLSNPLQHLT